VETLIGWKIWFLIQGVPISDTFDGPYYTKNEKYMKNMIAITLFNVFLIFILAGSIESMQHVCSLDEELNFSSNEYSCLKFEQKLWEISWKYKLKSSFIILLFFNVFTFLLQKWWIIPHGWHHHLESSWFL